MAKKRTMKDENGVTVWKKSGAPAGRPKNPNKSNFLFIFFLFYIKFLVVKGVPVDFELAKNLLHDAVVRLTLSIFDQK